MNLLNDNIKKCFFRYLLLSFCGSCIASIYGLVDVAMVGQYHGYLGTSAMAVVMPVFNIVYSFGLLSGIGGGIIYALRMGKKQNNHNEAFTSSVIFSIILAILAFIVIYFFDDELLVFFGADSEVFPLAKDYLVFLKIFSPIFVINQMLGSFLRNDNSPTLATIAILLGGVINIIGDYVLVFELNMGIKGAGLATSLCQVISMIVMLTHFISKKNTLKLALPKHLFKDIALITRSGFGAAIVDFAVGIITVLFNRQILQYCNNSYLSIYGVLINIAMFVQCTGYAIGQASQPIISINKGASKFTRVKEALKLGLTTSLIGGVIWFVIMLINPNLILSMFMTLTEVIKSIAPFTSRAYSISFIFLIVNIYLTYYFQSIEKDKYSFIISCLRGFIINGGLIMLLPILSSDLIWFVMPISELLTFAIGLYFINKANKALVEKAY